MTEEHLALSSHDAHEPPADGSAVTAEGHAAHGYTDNKAAYLRRLKRMVESDVYCIEILTQVSAMTKALESFALAMLEEHLSHCVVKAAQAGGAEAEAKVAEASAAIARLVRS